MKLAATPLTFAGFVGFNREYRALLGEWGLLVDGRNPVARTNVAPVVAPPSEASLYAFSHTVPTDGAGRPTFVAAGSGELRAGPASRASVVRPDDTSPDAMREKAAYVIAFIGTSVSTALLIAPTTLHRLRFREGDKEALLRISNR